MRILFTVRGQGRDHMTQAMAAWETLSRGGHELVGVVAGNHPGRATIAHAVRHLGLWGRSREQLRRTVDETRPDLILNFFEPLTGMLRVTRPLPVPVLTAAHQYALLGPSSGAPAGTPKAAWWLRAFIRLVGARSWKLALSFRPSEGSPTADRNRIEVAPPLLRRRVLDLDPKAGDYVLIYVATHGYAELVRSWHAAHPDVRLHCHYDRPGAPPVEARATTSSA